MTRNLVSTLRETGVINDDNKVNANWRRIITPELARSIDLEIDRLGVDTISQLVWCLVSNQPRPKCKTCGKNTRFLSSRTFRTYCSAKCAATHSDTKAKRVETTLKNYGVTNVAQSSSVTEKQSLSARTSFTKKMVQEIDGKFYAHQDILNSSDHFDFTCADCGTTAPWRVFSGRIPRCYKCQPHSQSRPHVKVRNFLDKVGVKFVEHDRKIIKPLELDFYLEELQLAIEVNGIYWHSEENGHPRYDHQNKTVQCLKRGITLIHLFEDDIMLNFTEIETRLRENYLDARQEDIKIDGVLEVDASWPLPQWFSATVFEIGEPRLRMINPNFSKQALSIWDSGTLYYTGNSHA